MSLKSAFNSKEPKQNNRSRPSRERKKRPAPFSIRLSEADRARLSYEAAGAPLGAYIKSKVLGDAPPLRMRRTGLAIRDKEALGKVLAMLGGSRLSSNLNQLAFLANSGSLPFTPEIEAELFAAVRDVRAMRELLMRALGKSGGVSA